MRGKRGRAARASSLAVRFSLSQVAQTTPLLAGSYHLGLLVGAVLGWGCHGDGNAAQEPQTFKPVAKAVAAGPARPAAVDASEVDVRTPDAAAAEVLAMGTWLETPFYKFRMGEMKRCDSTPAVGEKTAPDANKTPSWLGFFVEVDSKKGESFISARDINLRRGG